VASAQIRLRIIDGWQKIATVLSRRLREPHDEAAFPVRCGTASQDEGPPTLLVRADEVIE
jgi:hypothetical protein